jgi:hypothetical protein
MASADHRVRLHPEMQFHGGLLTPGIRRDLADLNRLYLEIALSPELWSDPRFAWCDAVRAALVRSDQLTRSRMAASPFALFEVHIPVDRPALGTAPFRVEENVAPAPLGEPWQAHCLAFAQFALFVALRLADAAPLAMRFALGLSPAAEQQLNGMCPTEVARVAASPDVVRPRWPSNPRFWAILRGAARADSASLLQSAHCLGICLLWPDVKAPAPHLPPAR